MPTSPPDGPHAPTDPACLPRAFEAAFNSGDLAAVDALFEPDAVLVTKPGETVAGDDRRGAVAAHRRLGLPLSLRVRHVYVCHDLALVLSDHLLEGVTGDGERVRLEGTATDVARRGQDGRWRYVIDNPSGVTP